MSPVGDGRLVLARARGARHARWRAYAHALGDFLVGAQAIRDGEPLRVVLAAARWMSTVDGVEDRAAARGVARGAISTAVRITAPIGNA
jgi:hypothetical protein